MSRLLKMAAMLGAAMLPTVPAYVLHAQPPAPAAKEAEKPKAKEADAAKAKAANELVERIKEEGLKHSQVMTTLSYLTDVIGPRLTGSPNLKRANEWTRDTMAKWGLENAHLEPWGPFGRGWSLKRFSAQVTEPQCIPLIAFPKAWSPGTDGTVVGDVVYLDVKSDADYAKYKGKLKGAIVLVSAPSEAVAHFEPLAKRKTDKDLLDLADAPEPGPRGQGRRMMMAGPDVAKAETKDAVPKEATKDTEKDTTKLAKDDTPPTAKTDPKATGPLTAETVAEKAVAGRRGGPPMTDAEREQMMARFRARAEALAKKAKFLAEEGAAVLVDVSPQGDGGTLFVAQASAPGVTPFPNPGQPAAKRINVWDKEPPKMLPQLVVAKDHYNRLVRMIEQGEKLRISVDLSVQFHDDDLMAYNTVAEIPGTDLKEEVVMLGGHMDSWHSGTGATDNAAGVAVSMEVVRIIKKLDLKPRRTIRIGLWSGEEQGLYGSRAYVAKHFGKSTDFMGGAVGASAEKKESPDSAQQREFENFSGYFNLDNGTGKIRGVYMQGNESVRPIFRKWLQPFREMGAQTLTPSNTGGTDHQAFDGIGLPGFQFIQDEIEYGTRTHHSNMDVYDRIQADDMKQAAVIMATFVYNTAIADEKLPRKPAPK
jgi:carboxypeptidase Q